MGARGREAGCTTPLLRLSRCSISRRRASSSASSCVVLPTFSRLYQKAAISQTEWRRGIMTGKGVSGPLRHTCQKCYAGQQTSASPFGPGRRQNCRCGRCRRALEKRNEQQCWSEAKISAAKHFNSHRDKDYGTNWSIGTRERDCTYDKGRRPLGTQSRSSSASVIVNLS